jgi:vacuolar iron transporter family protein
MANEEKEKLARHLFIDEVVDYKIYSTLSHKVKDRNLAVLLGRLAKMEKAHMELWGEIAGIKKQAREEIPVLETLRMYMMLFLRDVLGIAFTIKLLTRHEKLRLKEYLKAVKDLDLSDKERRQLNAVIEDEKYSEADLAESLRRFQGQLAYIRSIVLGLNDGLVEVTAAVAGIAVVATSGLVVIVSGLIIGISGMLSMAVGVYLASRSGDLVEEGEPKGKNEEITPAKESLYTGAYYLFGAIVPVIPFILGFSGTWGIIGAALLTSIIISTASTIIAIASGTSITNRVKEMLVLSLGAVAITVILGFIVRTYFGITI